VKNIYILYLFLLPLKLSAQEIPLNKHGLPVVDSLKLYKELVKQNGDLRLIKIDDIAQDVRYATANNFTHVQLYPYPVVYLRLPAYKALQALQMVLEPMGVGLKIFDGYRPYRVTEKMWKVMPDERYAADPKKGSGHNRGIAVDLTFIYLKTGKEFPMGTDYDDLSEKAHHAYAQITDEEKENRLFLRTMMEAHGFVALETEWWHYYLKEPEKYPLMDIWFDELK